ncbi:hypothetical protein RDMS_03165 [Deinococcus sp. RL]|uniref:hypothetical protein n=1 Tax=Deinococcus sp. RL TaxID=1489678 RepID=UPI0004D4E5CC|nr:hypothetical protein [Deinococcus sp. RL]KEF35043.1 hypothetical protein RDMS_03165 [Deinococcus sp. RL]
MRRGALLLPAALLLAGCAPRPLVSLLQPPAPAAPVTAVSGDISRWSGGGGSIALTGPGGQALARAAVAPDGQFTLPLPDAEALAPVLTTPAAAVAALGCVGTVLSSDPAARSYAFFGLTPQRSPTQEVFAAQAERTSFATGAFSGRAYLYTDRPTRLSGTVDCGPVVQQFAGVQVAVPVTVDLTAQPGWNALELSVGVQVSFSGVSAGGRLSAVGDSPRLWRTPEEVVQQVTAGF